MQDFCRATCGPQSYALARLIETHRLDPACAGLAAHSWVNTNPLGRAGLVDVFRRAQPNQGELRQANAHLTLAVRGVPDQLEAGQVAQVELWALNELGARAGLSLRTQLMDPEGRVAAEASRRVTLSGQEWRESLGGYTLQPEGNGAFRLRLVLSDRGGDLCTTERTLWVTRPVSSWPDGLQFLDDHGELTPLLRRPGPRCGEFRVGGPADGLLVVGWSSEERLTTALERLVSGSVRVAVLSEDPRGWLGLLAREDVLQDSFAPPQVLPLQGAGRGGPVYGHRHPLLEGVCDPGVWGHMQAELQPRFLVRVTGRSIAGGCSFLSSNGELGDVPRLGTALGLLRIGESELLYCTLPVVAAVRRGLLQAERLLYNIARWLDGSSCGLPTDPISEHGRANCR